MIWITFVIWSVFAIVCGIMENKSQNGFFGFLFLLSLPIIFYIPLFLKQNKNNLTFLKNFAIIIIENKRKEKFDNGNIPKSRKRNFER